MSVEVSKTALMIYLGSKGSTYHGKVLELREAVENWLAYIPSTFPHYTRHTVGHSDEIILQLSKLLFKDEDPTQIVIPLTAVEAYCLSAAAYLHDAGMVTSDQEKIAILGTRDWETWVSAGGGGARRWDEIQKLRNGNEPVDPITRHFLADLQTRFLIAEFIRRVHHFRAAEVIDQHSAALGRFAFDDPVLQQTIASICVAHGLRTYELEDQERFPDRRDVRGQLVNVRLMAILLRLGDLLDMSADRACPILLNAACPLPPNSYAHWTQYQRITHRLTAPDRIEIRAECLTQEEHRVLQDWCQWIVDEVYSSRTLLFRSMRHHDYVLPFAQIEGPKKTIEIRPAPSAHYFPSKWTFELDPEAVFQRLIFDVYETSSTFVRELIQNALDATRCQMYADLVNASLQPPEFPTDVNEEWRFRYPITVSLKEVQAVNALSQEMEIHQVLTVSDIGIGMDKEVIERYLLQVGRSFYTTDQFRRTFRFVPISRFGVGFLSVFAASDDVQVETYKPSSQNRDGPIRLRLTGPRNYLLTETGTRRNTGTQVEVLLREPMKRGALTALIANWCRRVEFPIIVDDLGSRTTVIAERDTDFTAETEDVTQDEARFVVRSFDSNIAGVEGSFFVFSRLSKAGEAWDRFSWSKYTYPKLNPRAMEFPFPPRLRCVQGISLSEDDSSASAGWCERLDYRGEGPQLTLARIRSIGLWNLEKAVVSRWEEILTEHLNTSPFALADDGWRYRQRLADTFKIGAFWASFPEMIPIYMSGERKLLSLSEIQVLTRLYLVIAVDSAANSYFRKDSLPTEVHFDRGPALYDISGLSKEHWKTILESRKPTAVSIIKGQLVVEWTLTNEPAFFAQYDIDRAYLLPLATQKTLGFKIDWREYYSTNTEILNSNHQFVIWLDTVKLSSGEDRQIRPQQFTRLMNHVIDMIKYRSQSGLKSYLDAWRTIPDLPEELYPPEVEFSDEMFLPSE